MVASGRSAVRRTGRILTGFGALVVLCAVLVGAPVALLALAGNPLPDHLPTVAEIGTTLTSRDDGRLFLRALALAGWFGWATFAFSVLVELCAQALRRPAPRLPGMSRQQRAAAALVGSVALIVAASPAASAATAVAGPYALPAPTTAAPTAWAAPTASAAPAVSTAPATSTAWAAPTASTASAASDDGPVVYRVARGDHLGTVAERYLDDFGDYRELAALNRLADPDRIHPGQLLKLPQEAEDRGARRHATGRLVARPAAPAPAPRPAPEQVTPEQAAPTPPADAPAPSAEAPLPPADAPGSDGPTVTVGAARPGEPDRVNRPLAVTAVLAVASIVGAQIGAVLGLRRRPAHVSAGAARTGTTRRSGTGTARRSGTGTALRSGTGGARRSGTAARSGTGGAGQSGTGGVGHGGGGRATGRGGATGSATGGTIVGAQARVHADAVGEAPVGRHRRP
ncbi:LysM domain-containing protein [Micromonospora citrea]|uniref:LysM domain-containing protein n=1 Tax=Micromonospora citrea TaxID=47855 RepID=A0A1C6UXQ1_9ACTN|nr:LysM domain-containing protein [Micromonospora citrea]